MSHPVSPDSVRPCLWMSAGLLTYRLCDRDFDCEGCPLDSALRRGDLLGNRDREALLTPNRDADDFPEDRRYTTGHCWVQVIEGQDGGKFRFGLDGSQRRSSDDAAGSPGIRPAAPSPGAIWYVRSILG